MIGSDVADLAEMPYERVESTRLFTSRGVH